MNYLGKPFFRRLVSPLGNIRLSAPVGSAEADITSNLVAKYDLSDLTDATGRGNTLTNNNGVTFAAGKVGNAAVFDAGLAQYLSRADNADLSMNGGSLTIALWWKPADLNDAVLVLKGSTTASFESQEYLLVYDVSLGLGLGGLGFVVGDGTHGAAVSSSATITDGSWYFIVASYDSATHLMSISVNNAAPETFDASAVTGIQDGMFDFQIGGDVGGGFFTTGSIDAVRIYKRKLAAADLTALYNAGSGIE
jgi:hypothetical protein